MTQASQTPASPATSSVRRFAQTQLPTERGPLKCLVFQDNQGREHVAMVAGNVAGAKDVLCRVHSECMTSEVFGSTKCDCRNQLDHALDLISWAGSGVVLYMRQEGRGIGLGNKIRAYALQEDGHDTVDANRMLGLPDDSRTWVEAADMLKDLGVLSVVLMTNNPAKVAGLAAHGVAVTRRAPHAVPVPAHAGAYMEAKRVRMGHLLDEPKALRTVA